MSQVKGSATIPNGRLTVVSPHALLTRIKNKVFLGGDLFVGTGDGDVWCALISFSLDEPVGPVEP